MSPRPFDVVLFDLGGVLVRLKGPTELGEMASLGEEELWARWLGCRWVRSFERGTCSPEDFAAGVVADWALPVSPAAFLESFRQWPEALYDGAVELVAEVRRVARVGCLSNSNELHWVDQLERFDYGSLFDVTFPSHLLGLIKPDPDVFAHITQALGVVPERVLFLDDNEINVRGARAAGWAAARVRGVDGARSALVDAGVL